MWCGAGPLQALSAHLPADNSAQAAHTEEILKQLRQMQEQVSPLSSTVSQVSPAHLVHSPALIRPVRGACLYTCLLAQADSVTCLCHQVGKI